MLANLASDLQFRERAANNLVFTLTVVKNAFARMSRFNLFQQEIQAYYTAQITQKRIVNLRSASLFLHELVYCF